MDGAPETATERRTRQIPAKSLPNSSKSQPNWPASSALLETDCPDSLAGKAAGIGREKPERTRLELALSYCVLD